MRDKRRSPVVQKQVEAAQLAEIVPARFVARREIGFGTVIKVADVMNGHAVTVDVGIGEYGNLGFPIAILAWRNGEPPTDDTGKQKRHDQSRPPPRPDEDQQ